MPNTLSTAEYMAAPIARELAHSYSSIQAEFFNAFADELQVSCNRDMDGQLVYVSSELTPTAIEMVKGLAAFIEIREEQR